MDSEPNSNLARMELTLWWNLLIAILPSRALKQSRQVMIKQYKTCAHCSTRELEAGRFLSKSGTRWKDFDSAMGKDYGTKAGTSWSSVAWTHSGPGSQECTTSRWKIDWPIFIKRGDGTDRFIQNLHANHRMLMPVYNFLDEDGDGTINKEEFTHGIELLNKGLPKNRWLDSDELCDRMDLNHVREVDLEQFSNVFNTL